MGFFPVAIFKNSVPAMASMLQDSDLWGVHLMACGEVQDQMSMDCWWEQKPEEARSFISSIMKVSSLLTVVLLPFTTGECVSVQFAYFTFII